jgi:virginiamycin B lyase
MGDAGAPVCVPACAPSAYCAEGMCKSRFTEYLIGTGSAPAYITSHSDGNLWFTTGSDSVTIVGGNIGRLSVAGTPMLFPILAAADNPYSFTVRSVGIVSGPDGNVWFDAVASDGRAYIGSLTPGGVVANYLFSMEAPNVGRVTVGPDGNIWAAIVDLTSESGSNKIEVCTTAGAISEKVLPEYSGPYGIVTGPDKNIWFTETTSPSEIGQLTLAGGVREFPPTSFGQNIVVGSDSNLWFTEPFGHVGRCTVNGSLVEFPVPTSTAMPWDVALGPDGNVWFTETQGNSIASITSGGKITEYSTPASPYGITSGPDGNIWFTEPSVGKVVRFLVP